MNFILKAASNFFLTALEAILKLRCSDGQIPNPGQNDALQTGRCYKEQRKMLGLPPSKNT